jgi:hypothetical protein
MPSVSAEGYWVCSGVRRLVSSALKCVGCAQRIPVLRKMQRRDHLQISLVYEEPLGREFGDLHIIHTVARRKSI